MQQVRFLHCPGNSVTFKDDRAYYNLFININNTETSNRNHNITYNEAVEILKSKNILDINKYTASILFKININEVSEEQRLLAKYILFPSIYSNNKSIPKFLEDQIIKLKVNL